MAGTAAGNATTCGGHAEHPSLFTLASHLDLRYFCWIFVALIFFTIFFEHELEKPVHPRDAASCCAAVSTYTYPSPRCPHIRVPS